MPLSFGPVTIGAVTFSLYWMLAGLTLTVVGLQCFYLGLHRPGPLRLHGSGPQALAPPLPLHANRRAERRARSSSASLLTVPLVVDYVRSGLELPGEPGAVHHLAVTGLLSMIVGFTTFAFTLVAPRGGDDLLGAR